MTNKNEEDILRHEIDRLKEELTKANNRVKEAEFGLVWMDVPEQFETDSRNRIPILKPEEKLAITTHDGKPVHMLIEGDNLHSLTCLLQTHTEKIDVIYIDPPYNTGANGFKYADKRVLETYPDGTAISGNDPLRHSNWVSFMYKRLVPAQKLLKSGGVIFISINEDQYAHLKLLCDKIFYESNYLTTFTVKVRHEDRILKGDKDFHETTEQLLMYRKSPHFKTIKRLQDNTSVDKYQYEVTELTDNPETIMMGQKVVKVFAPGQFRITKSEPAENKLQKINIRGSIKEGNSSGRFHMKFLEERNHLFNHLYKVPDMGDDHLGFRYFLSRQSDEKLNGFYFQGVPVSRKELKEVPYPNYLDFEDAFNTVGYEGGVDFRNGKKPVDFLRFLISLGSRNKNAVILDFFAGSGSTAHAVMEQNHIDGGRRQAILCTNNENNIASEVTYRRLKNVIEGYKHIKNQKETLFKLPLNVKNITNNAAIMAAREEFFSDTHTGRYDTVAEEVRKGNYCIYGIHNKSGPVKGLGNSLRYYVARFADENTPEASLWENEKKLLAEIHLPEENSQ